MKKFIASASFLLLLFSCVSAHAWLYYSKSEFRGRVIDAETKEPIEGAVIVVLYMKWEFGGPGGGSTVPMDAKETLSDKNGDFYFPSYETMIGPLSRERVAEFIFFKPGYKSVTYIEGKKIPDEIYLAIKKEMVGKDGEIKHTDRWDHLLTYKGPLGVVELQKAITREEKLRAIPSPPTDYTSKELPLFIKIINEEGNNLGLKGGYK
ncbi:MAG: carboxypeptidase regulatory-like domain-containing protein [Deltaproteobacteria bacterium]|nr:carboxypeptidase regulatory-like domain-containing protein [Deltaproteobacteria bacterium]